MPISDQEAGARAILRAVFAFSWAFVVMALAIHVTISDPLRLHADIRSEKLAMLDGWHAKYYSASFGSSHVHDGFNPAAFDEVLSGTPLATHVVNLGIEGGSQAEQFRMADRFLRQLTPPPKPQPCLVMLEVNAGANFRSDYLVHPRSINLYNWRTARLTMRFINPEMPVSQRIGRVGYSVASLGFHYLNVGMLSNMIFAPPLDEQMIDEQTQDDHRGQHVMPYRENAAESLQALLDHRPEPLPVRPAAELTPGSSALIAELAKDSPVPHVSFVYFEFPHQRDLNGVYDFPDHLSVQTVRGTLEIPIINLGRPDRFPQFYDAKLWNDEAHLSKEGSLLASKVLAEQLKQWYAVHGAPLPCGG